MQDVCHVFQKIRHASIRQVSSFLGSSVQEDETMMRGTVNRCISKQHWKSGDTGLSVQQKPFLIFIDLTCKVREKCEFSAKLCFTSVRVQRIQEVSALSHLHLPFQNLKDRYNNVTVLCHAYLLLFLS